MTTTDPLRYSQSLREITEILQSWTQAKDLRDVSPTLYPEVPVPGFPTRPCTPKPPKV